MTTGENPTFHFEVTIRVVVDPKDASQRSIEERLSEVLSSSIGFRGVPRGSVVTGSRVTRIERLDK